MTKTLEELRRDLVMDVGRLFEGVADTGGGTGLLVDVDGLQAVYTELDALEGGLLVMASAGGTAPEHESAWITSYATSGSAQFAPAFTAAIDSGDQYEIYLAPMILPQWDKAINEAILEAWPQVWERGFWDTPPADVHTYALPDYIEAVEAVEVRMIGEYHGYPSQELPLGDWDTEGTPGDDLRLIVQHIIPTEGRELRIRYKARYPELAAGESTGLDYPYIMAAGKRNAYEMLAAEHAGEADEERYLQMMAHWAAEAKERKNHLESFMLDVPVVAQGQTRGSRS
jgi:hypothetical protein